MEESSRDPAAEKYPQAHHQDARLPRSKERAGSGAWTRSSTGVQRFSKVSDFSFFFFLLA